MASPALTVWRTESAKKLDALYAAHAGVGGSVRRRRYVLQQMNASLVVQLAAYFQLFCRDLHTYGADALVAEAPVGYRSMLRLAFTGGRGLDRRNASPQTIRADFARFDLDIWSLAALASSHTAIRHRRLEQLAAWRNAVAHQDFAFGVQQRELLLGTHLTLEWARRWRSACNGLAISFDAVVREHIFSVAGSRPW